MEQQIVNPVGNQQFVARYRGEVIGWFDNADLAEKAIEEARKEEEEFLRG